MGCGASSSADRYAVADAEPAKAPKPPENLAKKPDEPPSELQSSNYSGAAAPRFHGDVDAGLARAYEGDTPIRVMETQYPLHCMRVADFLDLTTLDTHNSLIERGLVVPLDLDGEHEGAHVQFVSHQWLGYSVADPNGDHLRTMQAAFRRAMDDPEQLFKTPGDWEGYMQGLTSSNRETLMNARKKTKEIMSDVKGEEESKAMDADTVGNTLQNTEADDLVVAKAAFAQSVRDGWVWMDYISIPQTIGLSDEHAVNEALRKQALAIRSIPAYIRRAGRFWICTPEGAVHESGALCSYATWFQRGWCALTP